MHTILIVVAVVAAAYVMAHRFVERLRDRFLVASGAEYILVGLLLGPEMPWPPTLSRDVLALLGPLMYLAVGWVGLMYGMNANIRQLVEKRDGAGTVALVEAAVTAGAVGLGAHLLLRSGWLGNFSVSEAFVATWALAASAAVGSTSVIDLVRRRYNACGPTTGLLDRSARLGELITIVGFGLLFCFHHPGAQPLTARWDYANWILVTAALGGGLGVLFRLFLGREADPDKQFLALLGIVVFVSGAAQFLRVSPLLVNLILGMVLANVAPNADAVLATLNRYHRAMIIVLLVFAGALWRPVAPSGLGLAAAYLVLRALAKVAGGRLAAASVDGVRRDIGRGMLGHGEVAVAMALGLELVYEGPTVDLAFTAILLSVVLGDLWAARATRSLLIDSAEIEPGAQIDAEGPDAPERGEA